MHRQPENLKKSRDPNFDLFEKTVDSLPFKLGTWPKRKNIFSNPCGLWDWEDKRHAVKSKSTNCF